MKMTRDEGSWSPEFWQASGSLGIDLNGLDISGTVDATFTELDALCLDLSSPFRTSAHPMRQMHLPKQVLIQRNQLSPQEMQQRRQTQRHQQNQNRTTEEIADDESFDVDTIFTSGTFEIEGGGNLITPSSKAKLISLK